MTDVSGATAAAAIVEGEEDEEEDDDDDELYTASAAPGAPICRDVVFACLIYSSYFAYTHICICIHAAVEPNPAQAAVTSDAVLDDVTKDATAADDAPAQAQHRASQLERSVRERALQFRRATSERANTHMTRLDADLVKTYTGASLLDYLKFYFQIFLFF